MKKQKLRPINLKDPLKESRFKELCELLSRAGHVVRREKLKQGHGFRVVSGVCRAQEESIIFVDQRLSQDEQIAFLVSKVETLGLKMDLIQSSGITG